MTISKPKPARFRVIPVEQGLTLRALLARRMRDLDRNQCAELIRRGGVYVNRLRIRLPQVVVAPGERITVYREALEVEPLDPARLVFVHREREFVVVDKPAGVPVAAVCETSIGCLSEALVNQLEREGIKRPYVGVAHRLDRGASGLVLFTIRSIANKSLHQQFREHRMGRRYRLRTHALHDEQAQREVPATITIDTPLGRLRGGGVALGTTGSQDAIPAVTHLRHIGRIELLCSPANRETGPHVAHGFASTSKPARQRRQTSPRSTHVHRACRGDPPMTAATPVVLTASEIAE